MNDAYWVGPAKIDGNFTINKPLTSNHRRYLKAFANSARLQREESIVNKIPDPIREKVGLPIGSEGCYFVGSCQGSYEGEDASILDRFSSAGESPSLWCCWAVTQKDKVIWIPNTNSFQMQIDWIQYLINNFFSIWDYQLNGQVKWHGNMSNQIGKIKIQNNKVESYNLSIFS